MTQLSTDPRRVAVWTAMAEHFLDTETRHEIPLTALACVEAGLSVDQARMTWQDEITPVVGANLFDMAGEWAGWDQKWLVESIERQRQGLALPGPCRWLRYWLVGGGGGAHGVWASVARCMAALLAAPDRDRRRELVQDLLFLARHCFDFCPRDISKLEPAQRARLLELGPESVLELFRPALLRSEVTEATERVEAALARAEEASDVDLPALRRKFMSAVRAAGGTGDGAAVFDSLVRRYTEAGRHYHTLRHVESCLDWLDWCYGLPQRPAEVTLALWFHDAVYDPRATDNERRSAELARTELAALGVSEDVCQRIAEHVLATQRHAAQGDGALVVDIDLAILGTREREFARFEAQIRSEYAWVGEAEFRTGRSHVLRGFLARSSIYALPALRQELESRARANLERRIRELDQSRG